MLTMALLQAARHCALSKTLCLRYGTLTKCYSEEASIPFQRIAFHGKEDASECKVGAFRNSKGTNLFCKYWTPHREPQAMVYIAHGFGEHLQWYNPLGHYLADNGVLVFGHDYEGHGLSEGIRGRTDFAQFSRDMIQHVEMMKNLHPESPVLGISFSIGCGILLKTIVHKPDMLKGLVTLSPIMATGAAFTFWRELLLKTMLKLAPHIQLGKFNPKALTRDEKVQMSLSQDPLMWKGGVPLSLMWSIIENYLHVLSNLEKIDLPLLIIHGNDDRIPNMSGSRKLLEGARTQDKTLQIYPRAKHHLLLEIPDVREKVIHEIMKWMLPKMTAV